MNQENVLEVVKGEEMWLPEAVKVKIIIKSLGLKSEHFEQVETTIDIEKVWNEFSTEEKEIALADKSKKFIFADFPHTKTIEDEASNAKVRLSYALVEKIYKSLYFELLDGDGKYIEDSESVKTVQRYEVKRGIEEARKAGYKEGYQRGYKAGQQEA